MNDFDWNDRRWDAMWVSYDAWPSEPETPKRIVTEKSTATIDEMKRKFGVS